MFKKLLAFPALLAPLALAFPAGSVTISDFDDGTIDIQIDDPTGADPDFASQFATPNAIGGYTDVVINSANAQNPGSNPAGIETSVFDGQGASASQLDVSNSAGIDSTVSLIWDGLDELAGTVNETGLDGVDLTDEGTDTGFLFDVALNDLPLSTEVTVFGSEAEASFMLAPGGGQNFLPFDDFSGTVDFANVGAVQVDLLSEENSIDLSLNSITTGSRPVDTPTTGPLAAAGVALVVATFLVARRDRLTQQRF